MKRNNAFEVKIVDSKKCLQPLRAQLNEPPDKPLSVVCESQDSLNAFHIRAKCFADFDFFFADFSNEICRMRMKQKDVDRIFHLCEQLIENQKILCDSLIGQMDAEKAVSKATEYAREKLKQSNQRSRDIKSSEVIHFSLNP